MNDEYSRRSFIGAGALALMSTAVADLATAQTTKETPGKTDDPKSAQNSANKTRVAACNCGQIRVTVKGPDPERRSLCHCNLCQKQSGSVISVQARFPKEQVTIEGKATAWKVPLADAKALPYGNCAALGGGGTYYFCPVCASTVYYTADADPDRIGVRIGTFADPTFPPPLVSSFEEYQHTWAMNIAKLKLKHVG